MVIRDGDFVVRPDLVDERRYDMLVIAGWIVLRFCYEDVMFRPDEVRRVLVAAVALAEVLGQTRRTGGRAA